MREIGVEAVKRALLDGEFRKRFAKHGDLIDKWIDNPGCKCNAPLYSAILEDVASLREYFGEDIVVVGQQGGPAEQVNRWTVINCSIHELERELAKLPPGPKQIAIARFEDRVTAVVNDPIFD